MADPAYYSSPSLATQIHQKEHHLTLYLREGDGDEAKNILVGDVGSNSGYMGVFDWAIYDGPGNNAKPVARAQGQRLGVGSSSPTGGAMLHYCFSLAFIDERFHKSSLKILGEIGDEEGECAIIGGTGEFAYAQGLVVFKKIKTSMVSGSWTTKELDVRALCSAMSPIDQQPVEEHTIIDDSLGSTVATPTNLTSQGDKTSGLDGSPTTPTCKNKHQTDQGADTTPALDSANSSTKSMKRSRSDPPVVDNKHPKKPKKSNSFQKY